MFLVHSYNQRFSAVLRPLTDVARSQLTYACLGECIYTWQVVHRASGCRRIVVQSFVPSEAVRPSVLWPDR